MLAFFFHWVEVLPEGFWRDPSSRARGGAPHTPVQIPRRKRVAVTGSAPESQHRIRFIGLERLAAEQAGVLVGLEVGEPNNDWLGIKRCGNRAHAFRQSLDEEIGRALIISHETSDRSLRLRRDDLLQFEKRHRVHTDMLAGDEFHTCETDSGLRLHGHPGTPFRGCRH
jgi:hypothetical protein